MELPFSLPTYGSRLQRVLERMSGQGIDVLLVTLPDNIFYLTGYNTIGYLWFQALIVSSSLEEPVFVTRTTEEPGVWLTSCIRDAVFYDIAVDDPVHVTAEVLRKRGLAERTVGVEMASFTLLPSQWENLRRELPTASFRDGSLIVAEERLVKDPQEVAYQRQAARMADAGVRAGLEALRPGLTEVQVAGIMAEALGAAGSEYQAIPPMVASGERSAMIHAMPSRRVLLAGDVVILELAGVCNRYHAVVMRTAVLGRPPKRVAEVAACLERAIEAAIASIRPGVPAGAPEAACNEVLAEMDLVRRRAHRLGYSLGLAYPPTWLEAMFLHGSDPHALAPNMSFTIEPNLALPDEGFGLKLGDTVLCTEEGGESLSSLGHGLVVVE